MTLAYPGAQAALGPKALVVAWARRRGSVPSPNRVESPWTVHVTVEEPLEN